MDLYKTNKNGCGMVRTKNTLLQVVHLILLYMRLLNMMIDMTKSEEYDDIIDEMLQNI